MCPHGGAPCYLEHGRSREIHFYSQHITRTIFDVRVQTICASVFRVAYFKVVKPVSATVTRGQMCCMPAIPALGRQSRFSQELAWAGSRDPVPSKQAVVQTVTATPSLVLLHFQYSPALWYHSTESICMLENVLLNCGSRRHSLCL